MSNAMNMDVTSFFGAWSPACPVANPPTLALQAQDTTSQWAQRAEETLLHPRWNTHTEALHS